MPLDQSKIQLGDGFSLRLDPKAGGLDGMIDEAIIAFSHGQFRHKGMFVSDGTVIQQNPPYPVQTSIAGSDLDALFDRGLLCHTRIRGVTVEQQARALGWAQTHVGPKEGYGFLTLAELLPIGLLEEIPGLRDLVKSLPNPADYQDHPVCSVWYWLAWCYGLGYDYASRFGIGSGFITPADDALMIQRGELIVIQDKGSLL